jgi:hypothetical protein
MLRNVAWYLVTDVSGQHIGPIFNNQAVLEECQKYSVRRYTGNCAGSHWFSENVMLASTVGGLLCNVKGCSDFNNQSNPEGLQQQFPNFYVCDPKVGNGI